MVKHLGRFHTRPPCSDGSYSSICLSCFRTVVSLASADHLAHRQYQHICSVIDLFNRDPYPAETGQLEFGGMPSAKIRMQHVAQPSRT
jgi:hypothetical protein